MTPVHIKGPNWSATLVFVAFFALVTIIGFLAGRWRRGDLSDLNEWGLGGRRFGAWVSWFLIGGDLYTAYTVIAVPALVYAGGAFGLFAVPYTILIYPLLYLTFPRLWTVPHRKGYVTAADWVCGRYGNRWLALAVALTGIVATMPYIALQLVGMEKVIEALGFDNSGLAITIAFVILALYTYSSGLRRAGHDRLRQGHHDLHLRHRGGDRGADQARRPTVRSSTRRAPSSPSRPPRHTRPPA